jgi:hypothetical protein
MAFLRILYKLINLKNSIFELNNKIIQYNFNETSKYREI